MIAEIKKRSDAANVLNKVSEAHREVFELCAEYLNIIENELGRMNPGSPRLEPFLKGRTRVGDAHRFHMLRWAEIEATASTVRAQNEKDINLQMASARQALGVVDTALHTYPNERSLIETRSVLTELVVSLNVKGLVDEAEHAAFRGDYKTAKRAYRDALFCLGQDSIKNAERKAAAERISMELEKIRLADRSPQ